MRINEIKLFNGKHLVTSKDEKIDAIDGSNLTGLQFTQLEDAPNSLIPIIIKL